MHNVLNGIKVRSKNTFVYLVNDGPFWLRLCRAILIGSLLGFGFVFPFGWWVSVIGVACFFEAVRRTGSSLTATGLGWLMASVSAAWSLIWFWSVLPIEWMSVGGFPVQIMLVGIYWLTASLWLGLGGTLVGGVWWWLSRWYPSGWWWIAPSLWVGGEVFGSWSFALATWQSGIGVAPHFSFGYLGYLVAHHEGFFQFATLAGVYGLSWVAVVLGYGFYHLLRRLRWRWAISFGIGIVLLQWIPLGDAAPATDTMVAVVETEFTGPYRREVAVDGMIETALETAERAGAEYIVLPEDMRHLTGRLDSSLLPIQLRQQWGTTSITIIDSGRVDAVSGAVLRGVVYDNVTGARMIADKQYLVPQGEFLPSAYAGVLGLLGYGPVLQDLAQEVNYLPGPYAKQDFPDDAPGILFCFESVTPWGVRRVLADRETMPVFIAHPISHAWFHQPVVLWQQLDVMLRVQAKWNQVPIVSAGNLVSGVIYYPDGTIKRTPYETLYINERVRVKLFTL